MKKLAPLVVALLAFGCSSESAPKRPADGSDPPNTPCSESRVCQVWGWCEEKNGECIAGTSDQCRNAEACKLGGLCSLDGMKCVAKEGDCERSEWCEKNGLCTAIQGVCKK